MDVAKYIGLFLLKNQFCYVHGLGNLELKKKPASYDGGALHAPVYEVQLTPAGSIDDNLANFIATNEQISISKAANALRDFSTDARADLQAGKEVVIPALGKFIDDHGKIIFKTDASFSYAPPSIPTMRSAPQPQPERPSASYIPPVSTYTPPKPAETVTTEADNYQERTKQSYSEPASGGTLNWGRIILAGAVLLAVVGVVVFGWRYLQQRQNAAADAATPQVIEDTMAAAPIVPATPAVDTSGQPGQMALIDSNLYFTVILKSYDTRAAAERKVKQLASYGNDVKLGIADSTTYYVLMPVVAKPADTARLLDSLDRYFNPREGVAIY